MKNYFKIIVLSVIAIFAVSLDLDARNKKNTAEITFSVEIDCGSCVKKMESNLPFERGIKDFKVDMDSQTVWIKYQPSKTNKEELKLAIVKLGSKVVGVKPGERKEK